MSKLLVLTFDAITGPADRHLYPGVCGRLNRLRSQGWTMAIVANQPDCDWQIIEARDLVVGSYFCLYREDGTVSSTTHTVKTLEYKRYLVEVQTLTLGWLGIGLDEKVMTRTKTIPQALNEMTAAADLCGIEDLVMCPFRDGHNAIERAKVGGVWRHDFVELQESNGTSAKYGNFLIPGPGMLNRAKRLSLNGFDRCVLIGTEPIDRGAADKVGFEYIDFEDWRTGRVTV